MGIPAVLTRQARRLRCQVLGISQFSLGQDTKKLDAPGLMVAWDLIIDGLMSLQAGYLGQRAQKVFRRRKAASQYALDLIPKRL